MSESIGRQIIGGEFSSNAMLFGFINEDYNLVLLAETSEENSKAIRFTNPDMDMFKSFISLSDLGGISVCKTILKSMINQVSFARVDFVYKFIVKCKILNVSNQEYNKLVSDYVDSTLQDFTDDQIVCFTFDTLASILLQADKCGLEIAHTMEV